MSDHVQEESVPGCFTEHWKTLRCGRYAWLGRRRTAVEENPGHPARVTDLHRQGTSSSIRPRGGR